MGHETSEWSRISWIQALTLRTISCVNIIKTTVSPVIFTVGVVVFIVTKSVTFVVRINTSRRCGRLCI